MSYDARQIANWFIKRAKRDGRTFPITRLLKLVSISHGWHLAINDEELYTNDTQAWRFGPVVPEVYDTFKKQDRKDLQLAEGFESKVSPKAKDVLEQVYDIYSELLSDDFAKITHTRGGPWDMAVSLGGWRTVIPNEWTKKHYKQLAEK